VRVQVRIAVTRNQVAANNVARRAVDVDAVEPVRNRAGARGICADGIAGDRVTGAEIKGAEVDVNAGALVTGDDVAVAGAIATNRC
jgi:adhesin HecA-like repeat protein